MNITLTLSTATGKLFPDYSETGRPNEPRALCGYADFECTGLPGRRAHRFNLEAEPQLIDGARMYRLRMDGIEGTLRPQSVHQDGTRQYVGHLGPANDFQVFGWVVRATDELPEHIHLFIVSSRDMLRASLAQPEPAIPTLVI
jgi:hypothetical protein